MKLATAVRVVVLFAIAAVGSVGAVSVSANSSSSGGAEPGARSGQKDRRAAFEARLKFKDMVAFIGEKGDRLEVLFAQHAAYYKLERKNPDAAAIERKLRQSLKNHEWMTITVDGNSLKILEIR